MRLKLVIIFFVVIISSCNNDIDYQYIKSKTWNHDSGFKIGKGDIVEFKGSQTLFELKEDTIYYDSQPRAIIKALNKKYYNLTVTSIDGKETGSYRNDDESLESR